MNSDWKIYIGLAAGIVAYIVLAYLIKCIINLVMKLPELPEQYAGKEPVLICKYNSLVSCLLLMIPVCFFALLGWGFVVEFWETGFGSSIWEYLLIVAAIGMPMAVLLVFLLRMLVNNVFLFFEGGVVYRDWFGKIRYVADEEVQYVTVLDLTRRRFIRIHTDRKVISISHAATNYYKAVEYVKGKYIDRLTYWEMHKEEIERQNAEPKKELPKENEQQPEEIRISLKDAQNCLLQQTTSYQRDCPILFATNEQNELFLVFYFSNTFYIVKAEYADGKLKVAYDYRKKHPALTGFKYTKEKERVVAILSMHGAKVEFTSQANFKYHGMGCKVSVNQVSAYTDFMDHIEVYHKNINETVEILNHRPDDQELLEKTKKISREDNKAIWELLNKGDTLAAIKMIRETTGLGLAECKKIAENPYRYL